MGRFECKKNANMFQSCQFNNDISSWDVSNVTNMIGMFYNNFHLIKISNAWDVSNVTDMIFKQLCLWVSDAQHFLNMEINTWDVSNLQICLIYFLGWLMF